DFQEQLVVRPAAVGQQVGLTKIRKIDQDARAKAESADATPGFLIDDASNGEGTAADQDRVANLHTELGKQLGAHERAVTPQQRVRVALTVLQHEGAVEGVAGLDAS